MDLTQIEWHIFILNLFILFWLSKERGLTLLTRPDSVGKQDDSRSGDKEAKAAIR